jgi:uncharacterized protein YdiU (UPF0061 family)
MPFDRELYHGAPLIYDLGTSFFDEVKPAVFPQRILRFRNQSWATQIGLGSLDEKEWERSFARFEALPQNLQSPLALRYHGHQFRHYNPDLGDGRGFLYAQVRETRNPYGGEPRLLDLGTKGSGQTPYSRRGDGRLTLKGAVREVLATEMLESLGVYTSKTLSVFETGENLERHDEPSPTRSAVLVRLNHSHIRFGTFQRLAAVGDAEGMQSLLEYCIKNYFPHLIEQPSPARFLAEVTLRSADLAASWMVAGFVHGVLNTDNMTITGESFDYGPYRFLPHYDPNFTAAYFDHQGLYAYGRQPETVLWNLEQLASSLLLLGPKNPVLREELVAALETFAPRFHAQMVKRLCERLGVEIPDEDAPVLGENLLSATFSFLNQSKLPFEQFFFDWYGGEDRSSSGGAEDQPATPEWSQFQDALKKMRPLPVVAAQLATPYFQRPSPCSLLIDEIEQIWDGIAKNDDWRPFDAKVAEIRHMGRVYGRRKI